MCSYLENQQKSDGNGNQGQTIKVYHNVRSGALTTVPSRYKGIFWKEIQVMLVV